MRALLPRPLGIVATFVMMLVFAGGIGAAAGKHDFIRPVLKKASALVITPQSLIRILNANESESWRPGVRRERSRDSSANLYPTIAPAVVVVRTDVGHGTGFLIDGDGTLITNYHVIEHGLRHDPARQASYATVHAGSVGPDGYMTLDPAPRRAYVLKCDPAIDLAALKIDGPTKDGFPYLRLAASQVRPGAPIIVVGHPASGMLWTMRSGQVAAAGRMPGDLVNVVMARLASTGIDGELLDRRLRQQPSRSIIITSAGINPGDSGGPVLDQDGRVVAVTFAIPSDPAQAKFSYHLQLDELKAFLAGMPSAPKLVAPDPWALGPRVELADLDGDKRPDVLVSGDVDADGEPRPESFLFDLDYDTPTTALDDVDSLVNERRWDFEAAVQFQGDDLIAHYDTNNDGTMDLVVVEAADPAMSAVFRLNAGAWRVESGGTAKALAAYRFSDRRLARRFEALVAALRRPN